MTLIALGLLESPAAATGPWVNLGTEVAPNIIHIDSDGTTWFFRQWGRLSDSPSLGLYNGYLNLTNNGGSSFPWTKTLSDGVIHYDPRLSYDEDDWRYRVTRYGTSGLSWSFTGITEGSFTSAQTWTVSVSGTASQVGQCKIDWATAGTNDIVATGYYQFIADV